MKVNQSINPSPPSSLPPSLPVSVSLNVRKETKVVAFSTSLLARGYKITIAARTIKLTPFRLLDIGTGYDTTRLIPAFGTNVGLTVFSFMSAVL